MTRIILLLFTFSVSGIVYAQKINPSIQFWNTLKKHCGNAYEGTISSDSSPSESFSGKKLVMHVRGCSDNTIRIPFFVGDDKSRTWVLKLENDRITLKHDHRHEDGTEDKVTQYGGTATNSGLPGMQVFPADAFTATLIPAAAGNVWWVTINENEFSYNLRRIGTDRIFTVKFDLTRKVNTPVAPWGWKE